MMGTGTGPESSFRQHARAQAGWCLALGSPFTALLCEMVADRLAAETAIGRRLDQWPGNPSDDALALRLTGGLHALVRAGKAPALAAFYPPAPLPDPDALWPVLANELENPTLLSWLASAPQTNEVARSGVLMPGFLAIAAATGLPLALLELGSSAGLNLIPDRYRYRLGGLEAGDPESPLLLEPEWVGADPPAASLQIASRAGVDLSPIDLADPEGRSRLLAYVWPDQTARLERIAGAMALAAGETLDIEQGDAASFVETRAFPRPGVATTVYHSISFQYFAEADRQRIRTHLARAGASATAEAPLAWLRFEIEDPGASDLPTLRLKLWPESLAGAEDRLLARAHPHGKAVQWLA
ncbi:MAG: DUF2332 domain-containing protein [Sandaracinobacteroides sp.]